MDALEYMKFYNRQIKGVVHVGANDCAEYDDYVSAEIIEALYIEPQAEVYEILKARVEMTPGHKAVHALCGSEEGKIVNFFPASNRGESSSIFKPTLHTRLFPDITFKHSSLMKTTRLDNVIRCKISEKSANYNMLVVDTQGAEMMVLIGATEMLQNIESIYVEVSETPLYEGACTLGEVQNFLTSLGFKLRHLHIGRHLYGNAFFIRP